MRRAECPEDLFNFQENSSESQPEAIKMSMIVDEDADLKPPEAVFVSPLQRALQTAALMLLVILYVGDRVLIVSCPPKGSLRASGVP